MNFEVPASVRGFIPEISEDRAVEAVHQFISHDQISLDIGQFEKLDPAQFWSSKRMRSEGRKAHGWFFLREWNSAANFLDRSTRLKLVRKLKEIYPYWIESSTEIESMAFHDETTAQRTMNTSVFIKKFESEIDEVGFSELLESNAETIELLATDSFYAGKNNHGMFQDISILVSHALGLCDDTVENMAVARLTDYFDSCFTTDVVHTENNPTYHVMVSRTLSLVTNYLKLTGKGHDPQSLERLLKKADLFAAFCVVPNNEFPPISDTKIEKLNIRRARGIYGNGYFVGAISNGKYGTVPDFLDYVAESSGYAIFRTGWERRSSFAMFSAAYNDNYHKHSDELSLFVYSHKHAILAEAGPNGYQYNDPKTAYAFSSFAHNTLIVDDKGLPRIDGKANLTTLTKFSDTSVEGRTKRFDGVDWRRKVDAGAWKTRGRLRITDEISSDRERNFKVLWHLGTETIPIVRGNFIEIFSKSTNSKLAELYMSGAAALSVRPFYNQTSPSIQGISFPRMGESKASWVIQFEYKDDSLKIDWDFRVKNFQLKDRAITPKSSLWNTYYGEKPVRYLLDRSNSDEKSLLFVFSAVNKPFDFTYNYRASLADFPGTVCYIIDDFGDQGAYYLASSRNFAEFRSVQQTMTHVSDTLGIPLEQAIALGSSKGGTGAIIHGVSAGIKHVIAGAPQYKIGSFTKNPHPNILQYLAGGVSDEDIEWANSACFEILDNGQRKTRISVIVGRADGHFRKHAIPLAEDANKLGYELELLPLPGTTHAELGTVFRRSVGALSQSMHKNSEVLPHAFTVDAEKMKVGLAVIAIPGTLVLAALHRNGKPVGKPVRLVNGVTEWNVSESGIYRARVYFEPNKGGSRVAFGTESMRIG